MTPEEAKAIIDNFLKAADVNLSAAAATAKEANIHFYWSGPTYGMGGSYWPGAEEGEETGWQSSSNC